MVLIPEVVDAVATSRCSAPAASAAAGRWRRRWRSARRACGAARCGSPPTRPRPTRWSRRSSSAATSADTIRSRSLTGKPARQLQVGVDRRVGARRHARSARHAAAADPHRRGPAAHRPGRVHEGLGRREAGQLLRRPDRRHDERAQDRPRRSCSTWSRSSSRRSSHCRSSWSTDDQRAFPEGSSVTIGCPCRNTVMSPSSDTFSTRSGGATATSRPRCGRPRARCRSW